MHTYSTYAQVMVTYTGGKKRQLQNMKTDLIASSTDIKLLYSTLPTLQASDCPDHCYQPLVLSSEVAKGYYLTLMVGRKQHTQSQMWNGAVTSYIQ